VVVPELGRYFTVYAMDRRGRAASGDGPIYALEREFEDVAAVVDSLGQPVHLLGHSYGAVCALEAALLMPHVAKLILYEPGLAGGIFPDGFADELDGLIALGKRDEAAVTFLLTALREPPEFADVAHADPGWAGVVARAHTLPRETRGTQDYQFEPGRFADLRTPTLLLEGELSYPALRTATAAVHAALPHSRVVVMPGQAHLANLMAPELFTAEVLAFLRDDPG
jgi:pimeloyl-ACP methyl ester carboxylesterase